MCKVFIAHAYTMQTPHVTQSREVCTLYRDFFFSHFQVRKFRETQTIKKPNGHCTITIHETHCNSTETTQSPCYLSIYASNTSYHDRIYVFL